MTVLLGGRGKASVPVSTRKRRLETSRIKRRRLFGPQEVDALRSCSVHFRARNEGAH